MKKTVGIIAAAALCFATVLAAGGVQTTANAVPKSYDSYVSVDTAGSSLVIEPTMIFEASSFWDMTSSDLKSAKAASVIVTPDKNMNVTLDGTTNSLTETFDGYLKGKYIPVVRLDETTVDPFIEWMNTTYTVKDMMAISSDIGVIQKLYADDVCYIVNTVYDLTDKTITNNRYDNWQYIGEANAAGCNILMYDAADPNLPVAANYVSAMTKVCWAYAGNKVEAVGAIAAGCYGVASGDAVALKEAVTTFSENGFARAQYIAAHRGITAYCNEQSLTSLAASVNEGATHIEIDLQITSDKDILICHNSESNGTANRNGFYFVSAKASQMQNLTLCDYSGKYGDRYPSLRETFEYLRNTDVIFILELKMDNASTKAVDTLEAIQSLKGILDEYPEMAGRYVTITFFKPLAEGMREYLPQVPVGFLGGATSGKEKDEGVNGWDGGWKPMTDIPAKIAFMRKYNTVLDETYAASSNTTAQNYLARGYTQNTWTFEDINHLGAKTNIATTNAAERCAMLVKELPSAPLTLTEAQYETKTATVSAETYCGWKKDVDCKIIEVAREGNTVTALLYYYQEASTSYGLYSNLVTITVA